jgi:RimJ/RimL family protein N-acetyltransferase
MCGAEARRVWRRLARVETERLVLRPMVEEDLDALVELDGFAEVRDAIDPFREHIPDDRVQRREYERRFVGNAGFVGAADRASGRLLGWFQYELADDGSGELELGYRLRPDAWGQGLATEGAAALLADALERPEVTRVYAHALLSNPASLRVMEKIGMTYAQAWEYKGLPGAEYEARPAGASGG